MISCVGISCLYSHYSINLVQLLHISKYQKKNLSSLFHFRKWKHLKRLSLKRFIVLHTNYEGNKALPQESIFLFSISA